VLEAVAVAIEQETAELEPLATIGRPRPTVTETDRRLAFSASGQFWRAAAFVLLASVVERTREIGLRMALGARRRDIRRQFFAEAGLIGFIGGVAGILIGYGADHLLAAVIGQIARRQGGDDPGAIAYHTPGIALGCLAFSVILSLLAGTFPAARAARLDPIATLRHE
jgi:putative ABC transport system permease protein